VDFVQRLEVVLNGLQQVQSTATGATTDTTMQEPYAEPATNTPNSSIEASSVESGPSGPSAADPTAAHSTSNPSAPSVAQGRSSERVQQMLQERKVRLEADQKAKAAAAKAEKAAQAKSRLEAMEDGPDKAKKTADIKYAQMQKKRQQDAKEERARILKRVEDDKAERRNKEAQRKALLTADPAKDGAIQDKNSLAGVAHNLPTRSDASRTCAVQIRLFDGSTIRSRFPSTDTLRKEVRHWVDGQRDGDDTPYTFKQVLTPHPNRTISISEEEESLQSLGLTPSATLIIVPVKEFTTAYDSAGGNALTRGVSAGYGLVSSGVGLVTGFLGSFLGGNAATEAQAPQTEFPPTPSESGSSSNARVRTLRDQRGDREDHQLYNGNTVSQDQPINTVDTDEL
jgi:chemotaxis protein histidine kinase CheA